MNGLKYFPFQFVYDGTLLLERGEPMSIENLITATWWDGSRDKK